MNNKKPDKHDRHSLVKGVLYLIRDVFFYRELEEIKQFLDEVMEDKRNTGHDKHPY
tara:strand:+ start:802 stop:969 length:168 start_codon:yes stop_codon:yes gene_type:complete